MSPRAQATTDFDSDSDMRLIDSFTAPSMTQELSWERDVTGVERMMLTAQGDLQRLLSAFFGRRISVECIYSKTTPRLGPASPVNPIVQTRQVDLLCSGRALCIATSTITLTCPVTERLFLDEKHPIGQVFREMGRKPEFMLVNVETSTAPSGLRELRRFYKLETEGILCEIHEVFPDRNMFVLGTAWLDRKAESFKMDADL